ncbi:MAG: DUF4232 domain-containing protein [Candidatus Nanopelagicales bacterium]|nr:DUF4232 domain-containing protein [Candidatus Nanopelagicales bacterium]MDZ4250259.1 DUF4232 domain-containing protein [Candidatus Nanopelagicales bacterium]
MSSVIRPVGPEEPQTYWKRRAAIVVGVLVVLLILFLVFKPSGSDAEPDAAPSPSPTVTDSASPSSSPSGVCSDSDIKVTVTSAQADYPPGSNPKITLAIANAGEVPCSRDVGSPENEVEVVSGDEHVWSSDDCSTDEQPDVVMLQPGQKASVTVEWSRVLSAPGCPTGQPAAKPGTYEAIGRNSKVKSQPAAFKLS